MNEETNKRRGFSLTEMIVVIGILAVLLMIFIPALINYVESSRIQKEDTAMNKVSSSMFKAISSNENVYDEVIGMKRLASGDVVYINYIPDEDGVVQSWSCKFAGAPINSVAPQLSNALKSLMAQDVEVKSSAHRGETYTVTISPQADTVVVDGYWGSNVNTLVSAGGSGSGSGTPTGSGSGGSTPLPGGLGGGGSAGSSCTHTWKPNPSVETAHKCDNCGKNEPHTYVAGVCSVCGKTGSSCLHTRIEQLDATNHHCRDCDEDLPHTYPVSGLTAKCEECGYIKDHACTPDADNKCTQCGEQVNIASHQLYIKVSNHVLFMRATPSVGYTATTFRTEYITGSQSNNRENIYKVVIEEDLYPDTCKYLFYFMYRLQEIEHIERLHTDFCSDMSYMFSYVGYQASTFTIGDISDWNVSNVTDMSYMFAFIGYNSTSALPIGNIGKWDVSKVTDMSYMFASAWSSSSTWCPGDFSHWDVSHVTNMERMFDHAGYSSTTCSIGDISGWNTGNVTNMNGMFSYTGYNATWSQNLSSWNVAKVTNHTYFHYQTKITQPAWP